MPLLVPMITDILVSYRGGSEYDHVYEVVAAPALTMNTTEMSNIDPVVYSVTDNGANLLLSSMIYSLTALYALSGLLFIILSVMLYRHKIGVY